MAVIYPIGGGKGGIGKSFIAASVGAYLAMRGHRVALVDLDLGASNLHTFFGIKSSKKGLSHFINKKVPALERVAVPTHIAGLSLISSARSSIEVANLYYGQKARIIQAIKKLPYDYILIDLGAGTNFNAIDFFLTSPYGIVIFTPEPTSIENTFRFLKAVYLRRLKQMIKQGSFNDRVTKAVLRNGNGALQSGDILDMLKATDPERLTDLKKMLSVCEIHFIFNQKRENAGASLGRQLESVCNRHFYCQFRFSGHVSFDDRVHEAIFKKKLFIELFPQTCASLDLRNIARNLCLKPACQIEKRLDHENAG